jgi:hypothetical protein
MGGNEGKPWAWCAGFVTLILKQTAEAMQVKPPIKGSFSCDVLAAQAQNGGRFVSSSSMVGDVRANTNMAGSSIFLSRRTSTDWTHTGFVTNFDQNSFDTIEGNTNDDGTREGHEVCTLSRGYSKKDFIVL